MKPKAFVLIIINFLIILLVVALAPVEKTLGVNARIVYLHGAHVWAAMLLILAAGIVGLAAWLSKRLNLHAWSRALGRTGLIFWLAFLPMSLYVMQVTWNGLFLDEPRFRIPLNYAIIGLLLQVGLSFFPIRWTSLGNLVYGIALWLGISQIQTVLHPVSAIYSSQARGIQIYFTALLVLLLVLGGQIARLLLNLGSPLRSRGT